MPRVFVFAYVGFIHSVLRRRASTRGGNGSHFPSVLIDRLLTTYPQVASRDDIFIPLKTERLIFDHSRYIEIIEVINGKHKLRYDDLSAILDYGNGCKLIELFENKYNDIGICDYKNVRQTIFQAAVINDNLYFLQVWINILKSKHIDVLNMIKQFDIVIIEKIQSNEMIEYLVNLGWSLPRWREIILIPNVSLILLEYAFAMASSKRDGASKITMDIVMDRFIWDNTKGGLFRRLHWLLSKCDAKLQIEFFRTMKKTAGHQKCVKLIQFIFNEVLNINIITPLSLEMSLNPEYFETMEYELFVAYWYVQSRQLTKLRTIKFEEKHLSPFHHINGGWAEGSGGAYLNKMVDIIHHKCLASTGNVTNSDGVDTNALDIYTYFVDEHGLDSSIPKIMRANGSIDIIRSKLVGMEARSYGNRLHFGNESKPIRYLMNHAIDRNNVLVIQAIKNQFPDVEFNDDNSDDKIQYQKQLTKFKQTMNKMQNTKYEISVKAIENSLINLYVKHIENRYDNNINVDIYDNKSNNSNNSNSVSNIKHELIKLIYCNDLLFCNKNYRYDLKTDIVKAIATFGSQKGISLFHTISKNVNLAGLLRSIYDILSHENDEKNQEPNQERILASILDINVRNIENTTNINICSNVYDINDALLSCNNEGQLSIECLAFGSYNEKYEKIKFLENRSEKDDKFIELVHQIQCKSIQAKLENIS